MRSPILEDFETLADNPGASRLAFGARFHHFLDKTTGRIVGTILTLPNLETLNSEGHYDEMFASWTACRSDEASTRTKGRDYVTGAFADGRYVRIPTTELRDAIMDRSIFERLAGSSTPSGVRKRRLRPRTEFNIAGRMHDAKSSKRFVVRNDPPDRL